MPRSPSQKSLWPAVDSVDLVWRKPPEELSSPAEATHGLEGSIEMDWNGFSFWKSFCLSQGSESFPPEGSVADRSEQSCALAWAMHAATGQGLSPEAPDWAHEAVSLESPSWFLAPAAAHKPITSFSSWQERGTLVLKYFKSGRERSTAKKGKCLRPAALSTVCILAHSPTKRVTGPSLRQNLCPAPTAAVYPLWRHWRISIPSYRILCSMAKRSLDRELDSKIHAAETQWHLFLLWKKRDWREQGPPIPPVKFRHDFCFLHPLPAQEAPVRLPRAPTAAQALMLQGGLKDQRPFLETHYLLPLPAHSARGL